MKFRLLEPCQTLTVRAHMPSFLLLNSFCGLRIVFDNNITNNIDDNNNNNNNVDLDS